MDNTLSTAAGTNAASASPSPKAPKPQMSRARRYTLNIIHAVVLILSLMLIVYISYDTFKKIPFLQNSHYMTFQFWVCIIFLADFFVEFLMADDKRRFLKFNWVFFIISIPYLNIVQLGHFNFSDDVMFYLRFVPLIRGAYAMAMVVGYVSSNRAVSLIAQYAAILLTANYMLALVFFFEEYGVNNNVNSFWDALYWAFMNCTTVGCYFSAVTPVGKVISIILPTLGMLMLPLFTVFVTSKVKIYNATHSKDEEV